MAKPIKEDFGAEFVRRILEYSPETGIFTWKPRPDYLPRWSKKWAGKPAGAISAQLGYQIIQIQTGPGQPRANFAAHRLAWLHYYGEWPPRTLDHANGVRHDNRIANLRLATDSENGCNKRRQRNNVSGATGIWWNTQAGRWTAQVAKDGRRVWRKNFASFESAVAARKEQVRRFHGEFTKEHH